MLLTFDCIVQLCYNSGKKKAKPLCLATEGLALGVTFMSIIANKNKLLQAFWLYFHIKSGVGIEWQDEDLPIPTIHKHINKGYFIGWAIDGYFGTKKGQEYLNDTIARILLTLKPYNIERLPFKPNATDLQTARIYARVYKLQEISKNLKSLQKKNLIPTRADNFEDFTFWAIKLYAEDLIRDNGFIVYESLENWALTQFEHKKERSTIKAKCRSVYNWYYERDFNIPKKHKPLKQYLEETMATRSENMKKVSKEKEETNRRKIVNLITGLYAEDYKKKNGAWNITKIAKDLNIHRNTVAKHLKNIKTT